MKIDYDVGDVVVCVKTFEDGPLYPVGCTRLPSDIPKVGKYYRVLDIKSIQEAPWPTLSGAPWVRFKNFVEEYGWDGAHFKKVEKGKDIFSLQTKKDVPKTKELEPV